MIRCEAAGFVVPDRRPCIGRVDQVGVLADTPSKRFSPVNKPACALQQYDPSLAVDLRPLRR
jgi:hypothetical protein